MLLLHRGDGFSKNQSGMGIPAGFATSAPLFFFSSSVLLYYTCILDFFSLMKERKCRSNEIRTPFSMTLNVPSQPHLYSPLLLILQVVPNVREPAA